MKRHTYKINFFEYHKNLLYKNKTPVTLTFLCNIKRVSIFDIVYKDISSPYMFLQGPFSNALAPSDIPPWQEQALWRLEPEPLELPSRMAAVI